MFETVLRRRENVNARDKHHVETRQKPSLKPVTALRLQTIPLKTIQKNEAHSKIEKFLV